MNRRLLIISLVGLSCAPLAYRAFVAAFDKLMTPQEWEPQALFLASDSSRDENGMALVGLQYLGDLAPGKAIIELKRNSGDIRRKALSIDVIQGRAFVGNEYVPTDKLKDYVNETRKSGVDYVIITMKRGSIFKELFPIVDACRHSSVYVVAVNSYQF